MHVLKKMLKGLIISFILCCEALNAFCQNPLTAPAIDTNSKAQVFAPGVVSSPFEEAAATFSPDGNTVYFFQGTIYNTVCFSKKENGKWATPEVASFSGRWSDWDPFLSPDGKRIFFVSNRPLTDSDQSKPQRKSHIWYANKLAGDSWSTPKYINEPFNLDGIGNYAPSVSRSGTLCFYSPARDKTVGKSYYTKWLGDHYSEIKELTLNGANEVGDPFIAPDESYIIFVSGDDLYISYRNGDGWTTGQKLGPEVNNGNSNFDPTVSPDGKTLYYSSARVKGFYKRDQTKSLNYAELQAEMQSIFNGRSNILMIPINIKTPNH
jgi:Tol biopolymer transport system component